MSKHESRTTRTELFSVSMQVDVELVKVHGRYYQIIPAIVELFGTLHWISSSMGCSTVVIYFAVLGRL